MKYALVFKGISYAISDYDIKRTGKEYTIDFDDSIKSFEDNIIKPLTSRGDEVDTFFNTNTSDKLDSYINRMNPKNINLYKYNSQPTDWRYINKIILEGMFLVKQYQEFSKIEYDYVIVTRFDIYIYDSILTMINAYLPKNGVSVVTPNNDCFFMFNGNLLDKMISIFTDMYNRGAVSHSFTELTHNSGIETHAFYSYCGASTKESMKTPFYRINRYMFTPKDHYWFHHTIEEAYDPNSKHYVFQIKPNTEYTSGIILVR